MTNYMTPKNIKHWVFDMDGTLTNAVHDFPAIRKALGIKETEDILAHLAALPEDERIKKNTWLLNHERKLAEESTPALGAVELVKYLVSQGVKLAILTRNDRELAFITLRAIGLEDYFSKAFILGRDEAIPKPSPDGLLKLASTWGVCSKDIVMVGDFMHDLSSGKRAAAYTILVNYPQNAWPELVDWYYPSCQHLLDSLKNEDE